MNFMDSSETDNRSIITLNIMTYFDLSSEVLPDGTALLLTVLVAMLFIWMVFVKKDPLSGMSGPRGLPIIGNAHQLISNKHEVLTDMSWQYGDVFRIKIGTRPVVVLNRQKALRQALATQKNDFSGRPEDLPAAIAYNSGRGAKYSCGNFTKAWQLKYKMLLSIFRDFTHGSKQDILEKQISDEARKFIEFVLTKQSSPVFDAEVLIQHCCTNMMTRILSSTHAELDDPVLKEVYETDEQLWSDWTDTAFLDILPWLDWIFPAKMKKMRAGIRHQLELIKSHTERANQEYVDGSTRDVYHYLKTKIANLHLSDRKGVTMTDQQLQDTIYDLYPLGPYATFNWVFVYAIVFPEIQKEIQDEIDAVVGRERIPTLSDRASLPLTEAFLLEVSRHAIVIPLTTPHFTTKDTVLEGGYNYAIPKGTMVICNLYSVFRDPDQWEIPDKFNPKRFLTKDGKTLDGEKVKSLMQFSSGTRMCLGSHLAMIQMFLFFAIIMHQCSLRKVVGHDPTLEPRWIPLGTRPQPTKMELLRR